MGEGEVRLTVYMMSSLRRERSESATEAATMHFAHETMAALGRPVVPEV